MGFREPAWAWWHAAQEMPWLCFEAFFSARFSFSVFCACFFCSFFGFCWPFI
jgi:hypothetical protein